MLNIVICDTSKVLLQRYKFLLSKAAQCNGVRVKFSTFTSSEQMLFNLSDNIHSPDIIYLDPDLPGDNGVDLAVKLRTLGCFAEIIFVAATDAFALDSFSASPLYYLLKDTLGTKLFENVFSLAVVAANEKKREFFLCESSSISKHIPLHKISYFEIRNRVVTVHFDGGSFDFYSSMEALDSRLQYARFIRVHRSFLVNSNYIDTIDSNFITLITEEELPLGSTYAKGVKLFLESNSTKLSS